MPLQEKGNDKTKLDLHGSVKTCLKVKNSYRIKREVQSSATAGARR